MSMLNCLPMSQQAQGTLPGTVCPAIPHNQIDADGCSPLKCGGLTPPFLVAV